MALSRVIAEIFNVEENRDLEIPAKSQSKSVKMVSFDRMGIVSYSNFVPKTSIRFSDIQLVIYSDLENRVRGS